MGWQLLCQTAQLQIGNSQGLGCILLILVPLILGQRFSNCTFQDYLFQNHVLSQLPKCLKILAPGSQTTSPESKALGVRYGGVFFTLVTQEILLHTQV